jgi:hypothetical protein
MSVVRSFGSYVNEATNRGQLELRLHADYPLDAVGGEGLEPDGGKPEVFASKLAVLRRSCSNGSEPSVGGYAMHEASGGSREPMLIGLDVAVADAIRARPATSSRTLPSGPACFAIRSHASPWKAVERHPQSEARLNERGAA